MKISRIRAWRVELPLHEGRYSWSGGNSVSVFDSTIVRIDTDRGIAGWGEACPLGPAYLPAYAEGVRQGLAVLAPRLIGSDPTHIGEVNDLLDRALKGHPYVKAPLDIACWDILGKLAGLPVCRLLGGPWGADFVLYRAISQDSPDAMARKVAEYRAQGYRRFQLKVGGGVDEDIERIRAVASLLERGDVLVADANTGWLPHEAARVVRAASALDVYIEQPCATYEECLSIRRRTDHAFVLDEVITDLPALARGVADDAMDVVNIKISRVGGLTRAREMRDFCVRAGIAMTIEDSWGGDVTTAAIAHLAHSTPPSHLFSATDFNSYVTLNIASDPLRRANGRLAAPERPGLGVAPREELLGEPVLDVA